MTNKYILTDIQDGVATLTLNRPEVFNSFNKDMALEFQQMLDKCEANSEIRCIVITGAGKAFCAGQDLAEVVTKDGPSISEIVSKHYNPIILRIRTIEKPIVAAINGVAAGAGANIALACDVTIASDKASFIQAFSKIGLIPDSGGTFNLPRLIGFQKASALMMLGDKISAADAEKMNMIYKVVPHDDLGNVVSEIAGTLAKMPTKGLGLTKRALNTSLTNDLREQLALEDKLQQAASKTSDYKEGVNAFLEKRKPIFTGQ